MVVYSLSSSECGGTSKTGNKKQNTKNHYNSSMYVPILTYLDMT